MIAVTKTLTKDDFENIRQAEKPLETMIDMIRGNFKARKPFKVMESTYETFVHEASGMLALVCSKAVPAKDNRVIAYLAEVTAPQEKWGITCNHYNELLTPKDKAYNPKRGVEVEPFFPGFKYDQWKKQYRFK